MEYRPQSRTASLTSARLAERLTLSSLGVRSDESTPRARCARAWPYDLTGSFIAMKTCVSVPQVPLNGRCHIDTGAGEGRRRLSLLARWLWLGVCDERHRELNRPYCSAGRRGLHEVGLDYSAHNQYHKHGAYLSRHADLPVSHVRKTSADNVCAGIDHYYAGICECLNACRKYGEASVYAAASVHVCWAPGDSVSPPFAENPDNAGAAKLTPATTIVDIHLSFDGAG